MGNIIEIAPSSWQVLSLQNSFTNFGGAFQPLSVQKLRAGLCQVNGCVKRSPVPSPTTVIATIPVGFRPVARTTLYAQCSALSFGRFDIETNGNIEWISGDPWDFFLVMGIYVT